MQTQNNEVRPRAHAFFSTSVTDVIRRVSITRVYDELHSQYAPPGAPARTPEPKARVIAFWRGGDGKNVKLDDDTGTFFDHARGEGGGILTLVQKVRECSRQEALQWVADLAGLQLRQRRQKAAPVWMQAKVWAWHREWLASLHRARSEFIGARDRARRYLRDKGMEAPMSGLALEVCELLDEKLPQLTEQIEHVRRARFEDLQLEFRRQRREENQHV